MDQVVHVDDDQAYETARSLAREEGIFVGMSAGAAMRASLELAQDLDEGLVVTILPDGGERYLSTPLFVSEKVPVPLKFQNTLTRKIEDLVPVRPGHVGIYACGPSLDGPADLGLARRMVLADLTRRYLEFRGFGVKLVINLADIDDRTVNQCLKEGRDLKKFTSHWEEVFFTDMKALGIKPADEYPKASDSVGEMIEVARELLDKGLAYEKLRSVYFNISRFPAYGKLSNVDLNAWQKGKTVDFDYYEKENPRDFTLFKRASLAELKAGIYWKTPWGNQRPGWHVECAAMATSHLGPTFDIHMASRDLIFPHGDNEIAITESLHGKPMANIWLHSEVVMADGRKVSRPTGADLTFKDLLARGYSAAAVRYWLMSQHYSKVLSVSEQGLRLATKTVDRLNRFVGALLSWPAGETVPDLDQIIYEAKSRCQKAMDNDLNFPRAMGHLFAFIRKINHLLSQGGLDGRQLRKVLSFMRGINHILGVMDFKKSETDQEVERLVQKRQRLREAGAFAEADAIRDQLAAQGVEVADSQAGPIWKRI
jgi:cysteinyl-tRNA synthetase